MKKSKITILIIMLLFLGGFTFYSFTIPFIYPELLLSHVGLFLGGILIISITLIITYFFEGFFRAKMFDKIG